MTQSSSEPLYSSTCSLRVGDSAYKCLALTIPFGYVAIYPEFFLLQIRYVSTIVMQFFEFNARFSRLKTTRYPREIRLVYRDITHLKLHTFIVYGITIEHKDPLYPPYIRFQVFEKKAYELLNKLHQQHN
jgi:hypothetical protein